jgi:hypothetical protein
MEDLLAAARVTLERIKTLTTQVGLTYVELPEFLAGVGIAIGFASTQFTVLSVMGGGNENQINVTAGILRDIRQDRAKVLDLCNGMVRDNPAYPIYLHDAEIGWDILVSNIFPVALLVNNPDFFANSVKALPMMADTVRSEFTEAGLGGQVFTWDADDRQRLFIESMM